MDGLRIIRYSQYENKLPQEGNYLIGTEINADIIVYQAYKKSIADFSTHHQFLGGEFSLNRMSWIKLGFLWMMYRSGWGSKENQDSILAIRIAKENFIKIIQSSVHTSFSEKEYKDINIWKDRLQHSQVRLQWDPDHDPHGKKLKRKAIQLGLKGDFLKKYSKDWIVSIENITPFVKMQREVLKENFDNLEVIKETVIDLPSLTF